MGSGEARSGSRGGRPRVAIGLPVYNGQNYLRDAIESILAQSYPDFRLIITDNCSTDATQDVCREYAAQDSRIEYHRHPENIGAAPNFNSCFQLAGGTGGAEYFKWAAHDDVLGQDFLKVCIERLDADPKLALVHTLSVRIDKDRKSVGTYDSEFPLNGPRARDRFYRVLWVDHFTEIWGLMRASCLKRTILYGSFIGSDRTLLAEMLLQGDIGYIPEYHFFRRDHAENYCNSQRTAEERMKWFDPKKKNTKLRNAPAKVWYYLAAIGRLPMPMSERLACASMLAGWGWRRLADYTRGKGLSRPSIAAAHAAATPEVPHLPPRTEPLLNTKPRNVVAGVPSFLL
ncbi:MAG: glycosyltransferase [Phycisphaeraceae bacterium]|nr:glycosyltransferase [Phycisphaeraceae bacterium]